MCNFTLSAAALRTLDALVTAAGCTHDHFATCENRRVGMKFNSRFFSPGTEAVDAFTEDWGGDTDNWLHPPWALVGQTVRHLRACRGVGTIVFPLDTRQPWWPLVATGATGTVWRRGIPARTELPPRVGLTRGPDGAAMPAGMPIIGMRLDFREDTPKTATTPGLRKNLQRALTARMRG